MRKLIKYPETDQLRTLITNVLRTNNYFGKDENGEAIYDPTIPKPILKFLGTVKLHGTSFAACANDIAGIWFQSRSNIINIQKDNAGSAFFGESKKESFQKLFDQIKEKYNIDTTQKTISIYGEWCGKGIQKNVAISEIEKSLFIFGVKISDILDPEKPSYWVDYSGLRDNENRIYNMLDYKTYEIEIDFDRPDLSQNKIVEMTLEVEDECPVAKEFGISGIGEGIVFTHIKEDGTRLIFKSKGEKHAGKSKVKTLSPVDDEKINKLIEIANKVTPTWRLDQGLTEIFDLNNGGSLDIKQMGKFIKWVMGDIVKEDMDILIENKVEPKEISKYVAETVKKFFIQRLNEESGLK